MEQGPLSNGNGNTPAVEYAEIAAIHEVRPVLELRPFERFVYVMSVLERYYDHDCSVLLGCARQNVIAARTRAFQQIGATEFHLERQLNVA